VTEARLDGTGVVLADDSDVNARVVGLNFVGFGLGTFFLAVVDFCLVVTTFRAFDAAMDEVQGQVPQ
jgi:hypothetical protein